MMSELKAWSTQALESVRIAAAVAIIVSCFRGVLGLKSAHLMESPIYLDVSIAAGLASGALYLLSQTLNFLKK